MKKILGLVILVVVALGGYMILTGQNTAIKNTPKQVYTTQPTSVLETHPITITSKDGRVNFMYPSSWYMQETTNPKGKGQFGTIFQSWVISSFKTEEPGQGGIPENSAKIDIEIQEGGQNLSIDQLVDCADKTTTCEKIGIDSEQFIKSTSVLNTGMKTISVATFYDNKILRANAIIVPGSQEAELTAAVESILNSFKFSSQ